MSVLVGGIQKLRSVLIRERVLAETDDPAREEGFTLIELMVVLLIIAVLLAIAVPMLLGEVGNAQERGAESNLGTAVTDARAVFLAHDAVYPVNVVALLNQQEPGLMFAATSSASNQIGIERDVDAGGSTAIVMVARSADQKCLYIAENPNKATDITSTGGPFAVGTRFGTKASAGSTCTTDWTGVTNWDTRWP